MTIRTLIRAGLVAASLALSTVAGAHETEKGPNGGVIVDAEAYHVELVVEGSRIEVFLSDHQDNPVSAAGYKGLAILVIDGKSRRIALSSSGEFLTGSLDGPVKGPTKGVVQITPPDGRMVQARFN